MFRLSSSSTAGRWLSLLRKKTRITFWTISLLGSLSSSSTWGSYRVLRTAPRLGFEALKNQHRNKLGKRLLGVGGGGRVQITPQEKTRVVALTKKFQLTSHEEESEAKGKFFSGCAEDAEAF